MKQLGGVSVAFFMLLAQAAFAAGPEIMPVKDIKPGMKGYGLTVFQGTKPEKFEIEVVGVLWNNEPHQDLIVVRSSHPTLSHTGICGGMSGSPIYIEGKLIGAASRFFKLFPKDLLTGVTPIERMIADGTRPANPQANSKDLDSIPPKKPGTGSSYEQIPLPFTVSGVGPKTEGWLNEQLSPFGVQVMRGGSGSLARNGVDDSPGDLQPGDAFGVQLMRGDIEFDSGGTVSYRDGNLILGFGHPFFSAGDIEMPMTTAQVYTVMSSLQRSDKMQIALKEVGAITIDRQSCVAGEMGRKVKMIPFVIRTHNALTGAKEEFNCEMIWHKFLSPLLFNFAMNNAVESAESSMLANSVDLQMKVWIDGRKEPVVFKETFANSSGPSNFGMSLPVLALAGNPFSAVRFSRIEADLEVTHERRTAEIEAAWLDVNEVKPGETVKATVMLRPYNREAERFVVSITVPKNLPDETYDLDIAAGGQVEPDAASPKNVEDLVRLLEAKYKASDLVTVLELGTIGTRQEGKSLRQLPFSVFGTLFSSTSAGITIAPDTLRLVTPTPYVLSGRKSLKIKVSTTKGGE